MKTSDFYNAMKRAVSEESGLDEEQILHSNREDCVDARYVLVHSLCLYLTDGEVGRLTGLSNACVNKIRNAFCPKLKKFSVRCLNESICLRAKELADNSWGGVKY